MGLKIMRTVLGIVEELFAGILLPQPSTSMKQS